jgi:hypothetical protein
MDRKTFRALCLAHKGRLLDTSKGSFYISTETEIFINTDKSLNAYRLNSAAMLLRLGCNRETVRSFINSHRELRLAA